MSNIKVGITYDRRRATPVKIIDVIPMKDLQIEISSLEKDHLPYDDTPIYIAYCSINQEVTPYFENGRKVSYVDMNKGRWTDDITGISKQESKL